MYKYSNMDIYIYTRAALTNQEITGIAKHVFVALRSSRVPGGTLCKYMNSIAMAEVPVSIPLRGNKKGKHPTGECLTLTEVREDDVLCGIEVAPTSFLSESSTESTNPLTSDNSSLSSRSNTDELERSVDGEHGGWIEDSPLFLSQTPLESYSRGDESPLYGRRATTKRNRLGAIFARRPRDVAPSDTIFILTDNDDDDEPEEPVVTKENASTSTVPTKHGEAPQLPSVKALRRVSLVNLQQDQEEPISALRRVSLVSLQEEQEQEEALLASNVADPQQKATLTAQENQEEDPQVTTACVPYRKPAATPMRQDIEIINLVEPRPERISEIFTESFFMLRKMSMDSLDMSTLLKSFRVSSTRSVSSNDLSIIVTRGFNGSRCPLGLDGPLSPTAFLNFPGDNHIRLMAEDSALKKIMPKLLTDETAFGRPEDIRVRLNKWYRRSDKRKKKKNVPSEEDSLVISKDKQVTSSVGVLPYMSSPEDIVVRESLIRDEELCAAMELTNDGNAASFLFPIAAVDSWKSLDSQGSFDKQRKKKQRKVNVRPEEDSLVISKDNHVTCSVGMLPYASRPRCSESLIRDEELRAVMELTNDGSDASILFPVASVDSWKSLDSYDGLDEELGALVTIESDLRKELEVVHSIPKLQYSSESDCDTHSSLPADIAPTTSKSEGSHQYVRRVRFSEQNEEFTYIRDIPVNSDMSSDSYGDLHEALSDFYVVCEDLIDEFTLACTRSFDRTREPVERPEPVEIPYKKPARGGQPVRRSTIHYSC
jgi:hypothetical protein